jgi:hypothetical protein
MIIIIKCKRYRCFISNICAIFGISRNIFFSISAPSELQEVVVGVAHHYLVNIMTTLGSGARENLVLNIAYPVKALTLVIQESSILVPVVVPMIKDKLIEPNPLDTSRKGLVHA